MTYEEMRKDTHDYLQDFLTRTVDDESNVIATIKGVLAQFICNMGREISTISSKNDGMVTKTEIIQAQIKELRNCITLLHEILHMEGEIQ